jgi:riboflavin kinase/FMN adenylyltransferase
MILARSIDDLKDGVSASAVTIGNFDGVHKGHQKLIRSCVESARRHRYLSIVVTFDPHPLRVLRGENHPPFITLLEQKLELIAALGVEATLVIPFTREFAAIDPETFVRGYLVDGLAMKELFIGYDYAFGKGRAGNYETLKALGDKYGYELERIDPVIIDRAVVSSTRIRDLVQAGHVFEINPLMGRFYQVAGRVVAGAGRGSSLLGFPTANLELVDELIPKPGVYAVWAESPHLADSPHQAVTNIGYNPTFGEHGLSVEVHIMDLNQDLYGHPLKIHFVQRIRDERKFTGPDDLKARIGEDVALARQILSQPVAQI